MAIDYSGLAFPKSHRERKKLELRASRPCRTCGKLSTGVRVLKAFCSRECYVDSRRGRGKTRRPEVCEVCRIAFIAKLNYRGNWARCCSYKCLAEKRGVRPAFLKLACELCGASFRRSAAAVKRQQHSFCSKACASKYLTGEKSPMWRGGSNPNRGAGWIKLAEKIRARDGRTCQRCTKTEAENGERLSVDHIVPWRLFSTAKEANHPSNLISLCRECHTWKTSVAERRMLTGDRILFEQYKKAITLPPLFAMAQP